MGDISGKGPTGRLDCSKHTDTHTRTEILQRDGHGEGLALRTTLAYEGRVGREREYAYVMGGYGCI